MWEFFAFVLFGAVMARVGAVESRRLIVKDGRFEFGGDFYRVTKIEE